MFVISRFFSIQFTTAGVTKIVRYTEDFDRYVEVSYIEVPLYNYTHNCNDLEYTSHATFMFVFNIPVMKKNKTNKQKRPESCILKGGCPNVKTQHRF